MSTTTNDGRTPARASGLHSNLGSNDLLRRLKRLGLPEDAVPRVLRFLERELKEALEARGDRAYSLDEIRKVVEDDGIVDKLKEQRRQQERVRELRKAGLADLSADELEQVLAAARGGRS